MKQFILGFVAAAVLLGGVFIGYTRWSGRREPDTVKKASPKYHCPMHPTYVSDRPGDCPICGMKLVPIEQPEPDAASAAADSHAAHGEAPVPEGAVPGYTKVTIPRGRLQLMGITLAEARRMDLDQSIRTFGRVTYDETRLHHVHTKFEGFIERLFVDYVGQYVRRGQPLFDIYSPELYATQQEYLLALRAQEQIPLLKGADSDGIGRSVDLLGAARQRLALWDISESQIRRLEQTRKPFRALTIYSPVSGYVTAKTAVHGLRVMPGENLYDIVDLSIVWVLADVYEVNLPFVRVGLPATITLPYEPGRTWKGRVIFIDPTLDPATRTAKARLEFSNPAGVLKPEMYADVVIGGARATGIAVPESAVIVTGERSIVFVARGEGVFEPREVVTGAKVRDMYEIIQGVSEGERVATGANFLLDSESRLRASTSAAAAEHKH